MRKDWPQVTQVGDGHQGTGTLPLLPSLSEFPGLPLQTVS